MGDKQQGAYLNKIENNGLHFNVKKEWIIGLGVYRTTHRECKGVCLKYQLDTKAITEKIKNTPLPENQSMSEAFKTAMEKPHTCLECGNNYASMEEHTKESGHRIYISEQKIKCEACDFAFEKDDLTKKAEGVRVIISTAITYRAMAPMIKGMEAAVDKACQKARDDAAASDAAAKTAAEVPVDKSAAPAPTAAPSS